LASDVTQGRDKLVEIGVNAGTADELNARLRLARVSDALIDLLIGLTDELQISRLAVAWTPRVGRETELNK
jgi:hypothetical protein